LTRVVNLHQQKYWSLLGELYCFLTFLRDFEGLFMLDIFLIGLYFFFLHRELICVFVNLDAIMGVDLLTFLLGRQ
jgi:hypothetical protein